MGSAHNYSTRQTSGSTRGKLCIVLGGDRCEAHPVSSASCVSKTLSTYLLSSRRSRLSPLMRWCSPGSSPKISEANIWKPAAEKLPWIHTSSTGPQRAGDWGQSQARLTATPRRTGGRVQLRLGWATRSHSQVRGVAGKEGMSIFIHCQGTQVGIRLLPVTATWWLRGFRFFCG